MRFTIIALFAVALVAVAMAGGGWHEEPKIIKIIKPVHVIKVVKHIPPPIPVIKYVKFFHHTTVGHPILPIGFGHGGGHGWW